MLEIRIDFYPVSVYAVFAATLSIRIGILGLDIVAEQFAADSVDLAVVALSVAAETYSVNSHAVFVFRYTYPDILCLFCFDSGISKCFADSGFLPDGIFRLSCFRVSVVICFVL